MALTRAMSMANALLNYAEVSTDQRRNRTILIIFAPVKYDEERYWILGTSVE
jgi:hypothetical protein